MIAGVSPGQLTAEQVEECYHTLWRAYTDAGQHVRAKILGSAYFEICATLFHLGQIDAYPQRENLPAKARFEARWTRIPPQITATLQEYLRQRAAVRRPSTVTGERQNLINFAEYLADHAPDVTCLKDLTRKHLEDYKHHLATTPRAGGGPPIGKRTFIRRILHIKALLDYLAETRHPDAPAGRLIIPGDIPIADRPLPRFIDDAAAAKLLQAARTDPDPFTRLAIEFLARTGLRIGEFLALTTDAVVQIGSGYWLRVPVGKLHNDRYIPLHPQLKELLDAWMAERPAQLRTSYLFLRNGRRIARTTVRRGLKRAAHAAGIGEVTPHQLRHTLATQAINRGMSLEALAALLGHKTLAMTLVYARIADKTVANEYFAVSEQVEALYDQPKQLPADAEGKEMRKLRAEMHRRMLGNGYCARPVELDCHFESICESCTFFVTTIAFRPTLQAQRDDAAAKGQVGRVKVFDGLLTRLDSEPPPHAEAS